MFYVHKNSNHYCEWFLSTSLSIDFAHLTFLRKENKFGYFIIDKALHLPTHKNFSSSGLFFFLGQRYVYL